MKLKRSLILLLYTIMMFSLFSGVALATEGNGDYVLTSISHSDAIASVSVSGTDTSTLTVDYGYQGSLDLSNGLDIAYNTPTYSSAIASFLEGSDVEVGGDPVKSSVGLDVAPMSANGRTYVPLRYVSQQLGAAVDWNATTKAITITQD